MAAILTVAEVLTLTLMTKRISTASLQLLLMLILIVLVEWTRMRTIAKSTNVSFSTLDRWVAVAAAVLVVVEVVPVILMKLLHHRHPRYPSKNSFTIMRWGMYQRHKTRNHFRYGIGNGRELLSVAVVVAVGMAMTELLQPLSVLTPKCMKRYRRTMKFETNPTRSSSYLSIRKRLAIRIILSIHRQKFKRLSLIRSRRHGGQLQLELLLGRNCSVPVQMD
mmetsp:Transcript_41355/g.99042  ORF Transcript_41355/g.99042 Transcript_41355/m.99042 type:complete len:221 (+) Transcript_41355:155-817(+)